MTVSRGLSTMSTNSKHNGHYMNDGQRTAHFVAIILSLVRQEYVKDDDAFEKIITNDIVIPELVKNYGYLHMFGYDRVIQELSKKEPLLIR